MCSIPKQRARRKIVNPHIYSIAKPVELRLLNQPEWPLRELGPIKLTSSQICLINLFLISARNSLLFPLLPFFATIPKPAGWVWPCWTILLNWPDSTTSNSIPNHLPYPTCSRNLCPALHPLASNNHPLQDGKLLVQMVRCNLIYRLSHLFFFKKVSHANIASQATRRRRSLRHRHVRQLVHVLQAR